MWLKSANTYLVNNYPHYQHNPHRSYPHFGDYFLINFSKKWFLRRKKHAILLLGKDENFADDYTAIQPVSIESRQEDNYGRACTYIRAVR